MMTIEQFTAFKRRIEAEQAEYERSRGALEQLLGRLKTEFGVSTIEEAKEMLAKMKGDMEAIGRKLEIKTEELKGLWLEYKNGTSETD